MILTDREIRAAVEKGEIVIEPFEESQIRPATYDLRLGAQGSTTSLKRIVNLKESGYLLLQPGDYGVVTVLEEIRLGSQYVGRFGLRSKYTRKGVIATTGPQIDPGYHGRLIIGIMNLTPKSISLPYKDDFVSVEFHRLDQPAERPYSGPYQGKLDLGAEEIESITESEGMALSEVLTTLRSLSENVGTLTRNLEALTTEFRSYKWVVPIIVALGIAVIGVIVSLK